MEVGCSSAVDGESAAVVERDGSALRVSAAGQRRERVRTVRAWVAGELVWLSSVWSSRWLLFFNYIKISIPIITCLFVASISRYVVYSYLDIRDTSLPFVSIGCFT